ncbi:MAG: hypothetical protein LM576_09120, partial [Thermofilum sp.]|nr:hypothetical protein [Thermofilum sp.]
PVPPGPPRALPGAPARGAEEGKMRMTPLAADDPMTLWSAAVGDAAAAMKGGLSLANQGEAGCGRARARVYSHSARRREGRRIFCWRATLRGAWGSS